MLKNEWWLFKENIYALLFNRRLSPAEFAFSILCGVNPVTSVIGFVLIKDFLPNEYVTLIYVVINVIGITATAELVIRRLNDSIYGQKPFILWGFVLGYYIYTWWGYLSTALYGIWVILSLVALCYIFLPHNDKDNKYGYGSLAERISVGVIRYGSFFDTEAWLRVCFPYSEREKFYDCVYQSWIKRVLLFKGRTTREDYCLSLYGWFLLITVPLAFFVMTLIAGSNTLVEHIIDYSCQISYVWFAIMAISITVRRLHDSAHSALWLSLLIVPVIGGYVLYLIFFKPSWISLEPYNKTA